MFLISLVEIIFDLPVFFPINALQYQIMTVGGDFTFILLNKMAASLVCSCNWIPQWYWFLFLSFNDMAHLMKRPPLLTSSPTPLIIIAPFLVTLGCCLGICTWLVCSYSICCHLHEMVRWVQCVTQLMEGHCPIYLTLKSQYNIELTVRCIWSI